ncbi:endonuclease/exonuclease/phosphatase family protein [Lactobacillus acetotolerans]|uniref:endonuclease/exonuclease/phosphatase family protein n=1 Tax=Lactobacillus acetotolerans TaxID=1600 RepID=UPI002FD91EA7
MKILKRIAVTILVILGILIVALLLYFWYMQAHYYRIPDHKKLPVGNNPRDELVLGKKYTATTYNIGFGAYNHNFDFFMDAGELKNGKKIRGHRGTAFSKQAVLDSTHGVMNTMDKENPDFMFFQEIDTNSTRSKHVNQVQMLENHFPNYGHVFANNFHSAFLAWPPFDPHGSVQSGLLSLSRYHINHAVRRKYPVTKALISKFTDLDRCFAMMILPVKNGKKLILINSHMSAYDKGGKMRKAQMKLLDSVIEKEYKMGNYVIVAGDYNHALGKDMMTHFSHKEKIPSWVSVLDQKMLAKHFTMVKAVNREKIPTVRATDMKYDPKVNYMTICDGYFVSDNIKAKATNINTDFKYADHNPVRLEFELK